MTHHILRFCVLLAAAILSYPAPQARACTAVFRGWVLPSRLENANWFAAPVPLEGVLVLPLEASGWPLERSDLERVTFSVKTGGASPIEVEGALSVDQDARMVIWRAAHPLEPSGSYTCELAMPGAKYPCAFTTRATSVADSPPSAPQVTSLTLTEVARSGKTECCDVELGACSSCRPVEYIYMPKAVVEWTRPDVATVETYVRHRILLTNADGSLRSETPFSITPIEAFSDNPAVRSELGLDFDAETYCVAVEAYSLVHPNQTSRSPVACVEHGDIAPIEHTPPVLSGECKNPREGVGATPNPAGFPTASAATAQGSTEGGGGCSVARRSGAHETRGTVSGALLLMAAGSWRIRSLRRRGRLTTARRARTGA